MIPPNFYNNEIIKRGPNMNRWPVLHVLSSIPTDLIIVHIKFACWYRNVFFSMEAYIFFSKLNTGPVLPCAVLDVVTTLSKYCFFDGWLISKAAHPHASLLTGCAPKIELDPLELVFGTPFPLLL